MGTVEQLIQLTPAQVDDKRIELCDRYSRLSDEMVEVEHKYNEVWLGVREECKTNTEADRKMNVTDVGKRKIELKYQLKAVEKKIGALRDRLKRLDNEARNTY